MFLNFIQQANYFAIDEEGVVAASVTGTVGDMESASKTGKFYVDRPFLFILKEKSSSTILFMGKVTEM